MKTQMTKRSHNATKHTREYKQEALEMWRKSGRSAAKVGAELGMRLSLFYQWAQEFRRAAQQGGPPGASEPHVADLQAEIRRLNEENAKLLDQREVLKKSLGILSETPPRSMPKSNK